MNPAVTAVGGSLIRALNARKKATSIDFGLGEPTLKPAIEHFERATRWIAEHGCRYSANIGDAELRAAIAAHYKYPSLSDAANVCVTTGSQEALYVVIKTLFDPATDEMLLVEPSFSIYEKMAQVEGVPLRRVSMQEASGFAFDADRILEALTPRTRAILLCSPCNPTGRVISREAVRTIARALSERPGPPVYVVHDEIYRELLYVDDAGYFGEEYPYTISINSLSKSNALTGLRLGWLAAPSDIMGELVKVHAMITSCASTFGQRVACEIFAANELGAHRVQYTLRRGKALEAARAAGLEVVEPDGAFYLCVKVGVEDDVAFAHTLLDERDVVTIPGSVFGSSLRGWVRTSFVGSPEVMHEGYARIAAAGLAHRF